MKKPEMTLTTKLDPTSIEGCTNTITSFKFNGVPLTIEQQLHFHLGALLHLCQTVDVVIDHLPEEMTCTAYKKINEDCNRLLKTICFNAADPLSDNLKH